MTFRYKALWCCNKKALRLLVTIERLVPTGKIIIPRGWAIMTETKTLREYIYVDSDLVNSLLAQFDEGLRTLTTRTRGNGHFTTLGTSKGGEKTLSAGGGVPGFANGSGSLKESHADTTQTNVNELNQDAENIVTGDYGVEILEDYLEDQLVKPSAATIGSIVNFDDGFRLYDFESLASGMNPDTINKVIDSGSTNLKDAEDQVKDLKKKINLYSSKAKNTPESKASLQVAKTQLELAKKEIAKSKASEENFETIFALTDFFAKSMPGNVIISTPDTVVFAQKALFRLTPSQLQMLQKNPRPLHVLGIVENRSDNVAWEKKQIGAEMSPNEIGTITTYLASIAMSNFGISQKDDSLQIRPISMYF